jgi:hypothetical protein
MPRIIVTADDSSERVLHSERVTPADFETEHFRAQLAERVAWAVEDAERDPATAGEAPPAQPADTSAATRAPAHAA